MFAQTVGFKSDYAKQYQHTSVSFAIATVRNSCGSERRTAVFHFLLMSVSMETPFNSTCIRLRKQVSSLLKGDALK